MESEEAGESETITTSTERRNSKEGDEGGDQEIQSGSPNPLISLPNWETPCSSFFQQRGAIDFKSYLRLKKEEKDAVFQYNAATKIQAIWRGFLTRCNLQILHASATKIQALIRGVLGRKKCAALFKNKVENRQLKVQNEAATKIQAAWKGHYSRETKLNFKEYKKIQEKNAALRRSIDHINGLESALLNQSGRRTTDPDGSKTQFFSTSSSESMYSVRSNGSLKSAGGGESVENLIRDGFNELANNTTSANRVAELYTYANTAATKGQKQGKAVGSGSRKKAPKTNEKLRLDSVSDFFPEFPNIDGIIRPNTDKVESLKKAIRLLRQQMQSREFESMEKIHHHLRTVVVPGIYSDIYTNELTEIEKELKAIKFWKPSADPRKPGDMKKSFRPGKDAQGQKKSSVKAPSPTRLAEHKASFGEEGYENEDEDEAEYIYHPQFPMVNSNQKFSLTFDEDEQHEVIRL